MDRCWQLPEVLATMPMVWEHLLDLHTAGADGRCRGCRTQVTVGPRWPCTLYTAAARARRIAAAGR